MSLEDLGNLGSFIGGALVMVSLLYLAFEIRQNTISLKASAYQESVRAANEYSALLAVHPDLNRLLLRALEDFASLDAQARSRVTQLFLITLRNFALNVELADKSLIPRGVCEAYEFGCLPFLRSPAGRAWWSEHELLFEGAFRDHIRRRLAA